MSDFDLKRNPIKVPGPTEGIPGIPLDGWTGPGGAPGVEELVEPVAGPTFPSLWLADEAGEYGTVLFGVPGGERRRTLNVVPQSLTVTPDDAGTRAVFAFEFETRGGAQVVARARQTLDGLVDLAVRGDGADVLLFDRAKGEKAARQARVYGGVVLDVDDPDAPRSLSAKWSRGIVSLTIGWPWEYTTSYTTTETWSFPGVLGTDGVQKIGRSLARGSRPAIVRQLAMQAPANTDEVWIGFKPSPSTADLGALDQWRPLIRIGEYGTAGRNGSTKTTQATGFNGDKALTCPLGIDEGFLQRGKIGFADWNWFTKQNAAAAFGQWRGEYSLLVRYRLRAPEESAPQVKVQAALTYGDAWEGAKMEFIGRPTFLTDAPLGSLEISDLGTMILGADGNRTTRALLDESSLSLRIWAGLLNEVEDVEIDFDVGWAMPAVYGVYVKLPQVYDAAHWIELYGNGDGAVQRGVIHKTNYSGKRSPVNVPEKIAPFRGGFFVPPTAGSMAVVVANTAGTMNLALDVQPRTGSYVVL